MESKHGYNISVVIPTYNRAHIIEISLKSVLTQTYKPAEIILIDDGSTDKTKEIVLGLSSDICYIYQENSGVSSARSCGVKEAKGDWIAFLDSDDEWLPHKLEYQINILKARPFLKWCSTNYFILSDKKNEIAHNLSKTDQNLLEAEGCIPSFFEPNVREWMMHTSGMLIHQSVFRELGEFIPKLRLGDDTEMWFRIAFKYPSFGYCIVPSYNYICGNSDSLSKNVDARCDMMKVFERILSDAKSQPVSIKRKIQRWIDYHAFTSYLHWTLGTSDISATSLFEWHRWIPHSSFKYFIVSCLKVLPTPLSRRLFHYLRDFIRFLERRG